MRTLLNAILKYYFIILFVALEFISISIVVSSDLEKRIVVFSSANAIAGFINERINNLTSYFSLHTENEQLVEQNKKLIDELEQLKSKQTDERQAYSDSINQVYYQYIPARVIKNTVSRNNNFITLDKGEADGIEKDFGVISSKGVVGVVVATSKRYSLVVSLLNTDWGISGKIKKNNYFGSIHWSGGDYRYVDMYEIPNHLKISFGDTIVTNGFSTIFPAGIDIGLVSKVDKNVSNNFFELKIALLTDFKNLYDVYIVNNKNRREQMFLEKQFGNGY